MNPRNWARTARGGFIAAAVVLVVVVASGIIAMTTTGNTTPSTSVTSSSTVTAGEAVDPVTGLPIVDGGNPAQPINGAMSNTDPRTPVVRAGNVVKNWAGLNALLGSDASYTACVSKTTGMNWGSDVPKFMSTESVESDPRYILAVNTTASDEAIRKIASSSVGEDLSGLKILRVGSIVNTRGFDSGGCQEFLDRRSMVRVTLGEFVYNTDGSVKGLQTGTGVLVDCHNPWRLPTPTPKPTSTPTTPTPKVCPPNMPYGTWPVCKDKPSVDPAPQGKTPVGGDTNLDPGPGTYVPPAQMVQPPATPYVAPAPPAVTTPPVASTPDPASAPTPQVSAPVVPPVCAPAPNMTTC